VTPWDSERGTRTADSQTGGAPLSVVRDSRAAGLTYEPFYALREKPFSLTSDSRFFYQSRAHAPAFEDLVAGIRRRESLSVLTGDIGTGKTTLCRAVLQKLDRKTFSAFVPDPFASREDLLKILLMDFGVASVDDLTSGRLRDASRTELSYLLYEFLGTLAPLQAFAVAFIDEAQNLSPELLDEVRILSDADGLLQVVLVGQLELRGKLKLPEMRNLDQRVSVHSRLKPLDADGVAGYISHRLHVAGGSPDRIRFTRDAVERIYHASVGVPRVINRICDRALHQGHVRQSSRIDREIVEAVLAHDAPVAVPVFDAPAAAAPVAPAVTASSPSVPAAVEAAPAPAAAPAQTAAPQFVDPIAVWLSESDDLAKPSGRTVPVDHSRTALDPMTGDRERRAETIARFLPRACKPTRAERLARKWTRTAIMLFVAALIAFVVSPIAMDIARDFWAQAGEYYDVGELPQLPPRPQFRVGAPLDVPPLPVDEQPVAVPGGASLTVPASTAASQP